MKAGSIFVLACALCEVRMMWRVCVCSEVVGEEGAEGLHSVSPLPPRLFDLPGRPHRQPPHPRSPPLHHHLQTMRVKRKNSPQNQNKMYSPAGHLRLEFVSSSKQIWIHFALNNLLTNRSSTVNGCRQNENSNS